MAPSIVASISRVQLGLTDLDINDHVKYILAGGDGALFGATVQWRRQSIQSPYVESQITVNRVRDVVDDNLTVDCLGTAPSDVQTNIAALIAAVSQDYFNVTVEVGDAFYTYACEASDYTIDFTQARVFANQIQVKVGLRRTPQPLNGPG